MDLEQKVQLARVGQMDVVSCAIRLRAARKVTGLEQQEMARQCGVTKSALANAEAGLSFPSRDMMKFLFRGYRIDFNFMLNGTFSGLPSEVQDVLFPALEAATHEWDQRESSNRGRKPPKREREG